MIDTAKSMLKRWCLKFFKVTIFSALSSEMKIKNFINETRSVISATSYYSYYSFFCKCIGIVNLNTKRSFCFFVCCNSNFYVSLVCCKLTTKFSQQYCVLCILHKANFCWKKNFLNFVSSSKWPNDTLLLHQMKAFCCFCFRIFVFQKKFLFFQSFLLAFTIFTISRLFI